MRVVNHGYVAEKRPDGRWQLQHRLVMERVLGRPLAAREQVHHIDGRKDNNHPDNLEVWARAHPIGVRLPAPPDWDAAVGMAALQHD